MKDQPNINFKVTYWKYMASLRETNLSLLLVHLEGAEMFEQPLPFKYVTTI